MKIEFEIKTKDSNKWLKEATDTAKKLAGDNYFDAEVFVTLPERGRCLTKASGSLSMVAHG